MFGVHEDWESLCHPLLTRCLNRACSSTMQLCINIRLAQLCCWGAAQCTGILIIAIESCWNAKQWNQLSD